MTIVRASTDHRIAIPMAIRAKLGIEPGQQFSVTECNGSIVLTPIPADPIQYLCGILKDEPSMSEELLRERT